MDYFLKVDWHETFVPQLSLPEVIVRGSFVYFGLILLIRVLPKRLAGTGTIASMLFIVMMGGIATNGVVGKTTSLTDIGLLVLVVMLWVYLTDYLSYLFPKFHRLVQEPPTCLIRNGQFLHQNLRREMLSEEDLKTQLRQQDIEDVCQVMEAHLEADGTISVITKKNKV